MRKRTLHALLLGSALVTMTISLLACSGSVAGRGIFSNAMKPPAKQKTAGELFPLSTDPSFLRLKSECAYVMDIETGTPLFTKNHLKLASIASVTKLMTALVIADSDQDMEKPITVTEDDVDTLRHSSSHLPVGWTLSREQLLLLALMSSENRAAHALARCWPGGMPLFVEAMNGRAAVMGLIHTHYEDSTGLMAGNMSTAEDLARIVAEAYGNSLVRALSTCREAEVKTVDGERGRTFRNTNPLVRGGKIPIALSKTGFIIEAGYCLVTVLVPNGRPVACVLLNAPKAGHRVSDTVQIYKWLTGELKAPSIEKADKKKKKGAARPKPAKPKKKKSSKR